MRVTPSFPLRRSLPKNIIAPKSIKIPLILTQSCPREAQTHGNTNQTLTDMQRGTDMRHSSVPQIYCNPCAHTEPDRSTRASRNHASRLCSARRPQQQSLSPHSPPSCTWPARAGRRTWKRHTKLGPACKRGVRGNATRAAPLSSQARTMPAAFTAGLSTAARPICSGFYPVDSLPLRGKRTQRRQAQAVSWR